MPFLLYNFKLTLIYFFLNFELLYTNFHIIIFLIKINFLYYLVV
jgi:hypothetical protein